MSSEGKPKGLSSFVELETRNWEYKLRSLLIITIELGGRGPNILTGP